MRDGSVSRNLEISSLKSGLKSTAEGLRPDRKLSILTAGDQYIS